MIGAKHYGLLLLVTGLATLVTGCSAVWPLHRSETSIRTSILKRTQLGAPCSEVAAFMKREDWDIHSLDGRPAGWVSRPGAAAKPPDREVKKTLYTVVGSYYVFPLLERRVHCFWLFDNDDQLLDVWVGKTDTGL